MPTYRSNAALLLLGNPSASAPSPPVFRSITTTSIAGAPTMTITKPSGTVDNDLLFAAIWVDIGTRTVTPPSGWTVVANKLVNADTAQSRIITYYKVAASEGASYGWGFSPSASANGHIMAINNIATTAPLDVQSETQINGAGNFVAATVTTTFANDFLVMICSTNGGSRSFTPDGAMSERSDDTIIELSTQLVAASGATGSRTAVPSSGSFGWASLAGFKAR